MENNKSFVNCNLCGANDYRVLFNAGKAQIHRIVKCNNCELIYANPQIENVAGVEKNSTSNFEGDEIASIPNEFHPGNHQYLNKQYVQLRDYSKIIDFVERENKGVFIEIGSYAGVFLNEAKNRGWDVLGIEPQEVPALYSERKFGIKVIREYFEQADIPKESIDVIVATHVIEHVSDPTAFVKKAYGLLKPGGVFILETPTYDSFVFKLLNHRERSVRCDEHIFFFTKKSLMKLVQDNAFRVKDYEKVGRTLTMDRLFYNFGVITGKKELFSKISKKLNLNKLIIRLNMRDMQRIYCIKE